MHHISSSSAAFPSGHGTTSNRIQASGSVSAKDTNIDQGDAGDSSSQARQIMQQMKLWVMSSTSHLHWCVDSNQSDTLLFPIDVPRIDDVTIIQKMKSSYASVKGMRRWISLTECAGVRFVLVC